MYRSFFHTKIKKQTLHLFFTFCIYFLISKAFHVLILSVLLVTKVEIIKKTSFDNKDLNK